MKILIIKTAPGEVNISKVTYNHQEVGLARALIHKGNQCDIMCCADTEASVKQINVGDGKKITLYCVKSTQIFKNSFMHNVNDILQKYDLLHVSEYNQIYTWHLSKEYSDKMICYHGPYYCMFNKRYNLMSKVFDIFFLKRYLKLNTCFITKSSLAENYLNSKKIVNTYSVGVGIDIEALSTDVGDKLAFVDEIQQYPNKKIMYIGRIESRRNVFFLLDILERLNKNNNISLVLVGTGHKDYVNKFFNKAKEKGIFDKIIYREQVEQRYMEQLYNCAEIFLLPTFYDIYGMVLLEAMYFRKCVITTINGGSNMMIKTDKNGYVIDSFDVKEWTTKIEQLLYDKEKRTIVSENARSTIVNSFTWQVLSEKFLSIYRNKLEG